MKKTMDFEDKKVQVDSGEWISVKKLKESYDAYPGYAQKFISNEGEPALLNCTYKTKKCGCRIIGNGTLQFPLDIQFCSKHSKKH